MSKMSINIFKKHPGNKVTFSNGVILSGELKIMGSVIESNEQYKWFMVSFPLCIVVCFLCVLLTYIFLSYIYVYCLCLAP